MFDDLVQLKGRKESPFDEPTEKVSDRAVAALRAAHPSLPDDYLAYLAAIGFGSLGDSSFMIYSGPISTEDVYGQVPEGMQDVVLIGDDFAGYTVGIDLRDNAIIEADPRGKPLPIAPDFEAFIRVKIARLMDG